MHFALELLCLHFRDNRLGLLEFCLCLFPLKFNISGIIIAPARFQRRAVSPHGLRKVVERTMLCLGFLDDPARCYVTDP